MKINLERLEDIKNLTKQLAVILRNLDLLNNFGSYEAELVIPATTEGRIRHDLNVIPTRYIIVSQEGNGLVTKGTTEWTDKYAYFYNNGASEVTIKVNILK